MLRYFSIIALTLLTTVLMNAKTTIDRVEPPLWWVGMHNSELMLMVHAENISAFTPEIDYPGVSISKVNKGDSPNYLFVYLNIEPDTEAGTMNIKFRPGKGKTISYPYTLNERKEGSAQRASFTSADVIYLLMPDRFVNGNPDNDSQPDMIEKVNRKKKDGRHGGDIEGIISKLDYLKDLGVTAIWPTPLLEDNMDSVSYHTYAITNLYRIDPRYGTNEDYQQLSAEAKKHDIKLIKDLVPNHIGSNHWWMQDLPFNDWVHQHDKFTRSNHRKEVWHDPYVSDTDLVGSETGWFDTTMPDLNQNNPYLLTYLKQNAIWWVEFADLDGIRVDTYPYVNQWRAAEWTEAILDEYPNLNIVGECWMHHPSQNAYWQGGVGNKNGYDSHLPSVMDFPWQEASQIAFNEDDMHWDLGLARFYNLFSMDYFYRDPNQLLIFLDNHDTHRFGEAIGHDVPKMKLALTHLLTMRGIPQIYYGTEMMMGGSKQVGDDDLRREIPGGWPGDERNAFTKQGRTDTENEVFTHMQKLLNYRKQNEVIHTGKTLHYIPQDNVYVYFRYNQDKTIMVVLNNSTHQHTIKLDRFSQGLKGCITGTNIVTSRKVNLSETLKVNGKTGMVIELIQP